MSFQSPIYPTLLVLLGLLGCYRQNDSLPSSTKSIDATTLLDPIHIESRIPYLGELISKSKLRSVIEEMWPRKKDSMAYMLHALHLLHNSSHEPPDGLESISSLLSVLYNNNRAQDWFGDIAIIRTRTGLRYITPQLPMPRMRSIQPHYDQALVLLGELELQANTEVVVGDEDAGTISDFVQDCKANFRLDGENEWSAIGLALYAPTREKWLNKYGEVISFDGIVSQFVQRDLTNSSCNGTHVLQSLAILTQVSSQKQILTHGKHKLADKYLEIALKVVIESQSQDGSLSPHWFRIMKSNTEYQQLMALEFKTAIAVSSEKKLSHEDVASGTTLTDFAGATAHHCEWMFLLNETNQPPESVYRKSSLFLSQWVLASTDIRANVCTGTHALRVVLALSTEHH